MSTTPRLPETFAVLLLSSLALACGSVGAPRPPLLNIPERADDFAARQTEEGIVLEWTWPRVTTEGVLLNDLARFDVYGMALAPGSPVPDAALFERESRPLGSLTGDGLEPYRPGGRVRLVLEAEPLMGELVALGVRAESRRGRSVGFSNLIAVQVIAPPAAPGTPTLTLTRDAITVEWPAVAGASGYIVERRDESAGQFEEIGRAESADLRTRYRIGETYFYRVRAIADAGAGVVEGPSSKAVSISPRDIFAPEKPAGLRAVATETAVELSWQQSSEPDLAGYRLRRRQQESEPVVLHEGLLASPTYSDREVARGQEYLYEVTAVDHEGNESELSGALPVRVPR